MPVKKYGTGPAAAYCRKQIHKHYTRPGKMKQVVMAEKDLFV